MNTLSVLVYTAELADSLDTVAKIASLIGGISIAATAFACICATDENVTKEERLAVVKWFKRSIIATSILAVTAAVIPSRDTVLMIAASEMAERVVMSEPVQSVVDPATQLLREWIEQKTRELRSSNR
jgi:hypothetical protein